MKQDLLTAIIGIEISPGNWEFKKYRNIKKASPQIEKFMKFAANIKGAKHVNWYSKRTKEFLKQIRIEIPLV